MKDLSETHPSLTNCRFTIDGKIQEVRYIESGSKDFLFRGLEIQKHTIDKAVLKELLDNWNCHNEEIRKTINTIKFRLGLEKEE